MVVRVVRVVRERERVFVWLGQNGVGHWLGWGVPEGDAGLGGHFETCEGKDASDLPVEKPVESMITEQRCVAQPRRLSWRRKCRPECIDEFLGGNCKNSHAVWGWQRLRWKHSSV